MWPRLISRGKFFGFNDAMPVSSSFNVAAADQPRKDWSVVRPLVVAKLASMWPRLISRGKAMRSGRISLMNRSFNVAAADQPRKDSTVLTDLDPQDLLQCGRG